MSDDKTPAEDAQPTEPVKKMIHRDDVPLELVSEIERQMAEKFPGKKIVFVGDVPENELPQGIKEAMEALDEHWKHCFVHGLCVDCAAKLPGIWPPPEEGDWDLPDGWKVMYEGLGEENGGEEDAEPVGLICPRCDKTGHGPTGVDGIGFVDFETTEFEPIDEVFDPFDDEDPE
jgi:hypothetical protein